MIQAITSVSRCRMNQKLSRPVSHNSCQEASGEELRARKQVVKMAPVVRPTPITIRAVRACWWDSGRSSTKRRFAISRILLLMLCIPKRKMATDVCTCQQCSSICVSAMTLKESRIDTIHRNKTDSTNNCAESLNFKIKLMPFSFFSPRASSTESYTRAKVDLFWQQINTPFLSFRTWLHLLINEWWVLFCPIQNNIAILYKIARNFLKIS